MIAALRLILATLGGAFLLKTGADVTRNVSRVVAPPEPQPLSPVIVWTLVGVGILLLVRR